MQADDSMGLQRWGIAFLRLVVGVVFFMHGGQKLLFVGFPNVAGFMHQLGIPLPLLSAVVVTLLELFGGLALIVGIFTRWVALLISIEMLVAVLKVHLRGGFFLPSGFEYALTLLAADVFLMLAGPGAAALDSVIMGRRPSTL